MDIKTYSKLLRGKEKELDELFRRKMPVTAGNMAVRHYKENFTKSGFVNKGLKPWQKTRRQLSGGKSVEAQRGTLLGRDRRLLDQVRSEIADYRVKVLNDAPYAPTHNWGATLTTTVTPKMRRFAWWMYFKAAGNSLSKKKVRDTHPITKRKFKKFSFSSAEINQEAMMWKGLALTKKKQLKITIPQRQFIGRSAELETAMRNELEKQVEKLLNL